MRPFERVYYANNNHLKHAFSTWIQSDEEECVCVEILQRICEVCQATGCTFIVVATIEYLLPFDELVQDVIRVW